MLHKYNMLNLLSLKSKKEFLYYLGVDLSKLCMQFKFSNLDTLNQTFFWVSFLVFKIIFWRRPFFVFKSIRNTYFKSTFLATIMILQINYSAILIFYNLSRFIKYVLNDFLKNKCNYLVVEIKGLPYVRNYDVRPEFYRWNSVLKIFFYLPYTSKSYNNLNKTILNYYKFKSYA